MWSVDQLNLLFRYNAVSELLYGKLKSQRTGYFIVGCFETLCEKFWITIVWAALLKGKWMWCAVGATFHLIARSRYKSWVRFQALHVGPSKHSLKLSYVWLNGRGGPTAKSSCWWIWTATLVCLTVLTVPVTQPHTEMFTFVHCSLEIV